jgi:hypothetical protein
MILSSNSSSRSSTMNKAIKFFSAFTPSLPAYNLNCLFSDLDNEFIEDEGTGNIPIYFRVGYVSDIKSPYFSAYYEKYIFENGNYLIYYKLKSSEGIYTITIEYWKFLDNIKYDLVKKWENKYHCAINAQGNFVRVSKIKETFNTEIEVSKDGIFQFLSKNENLNPDQPSSDGVYYGFMSSTGNGGCLISNEYRERV